MLLVKSIQNGFVMDYKGYTIVEHSYDRPAVSIGKGTAQYKLTHGSFKIRDYIEKNAILRKFSILENTADKVTISFEDVLTLSFETIDGRLEISTICSKGGINRFSIYISGCNDEYIYGCGEQYSELNLKGKKVPIWCEEQGVGRGRDLLTFLAELSHGAGGNKFTTYYPLPTYITSANLFCHVESYDYIEFDFRSSFRNKINCFGFPEKIVISKQNTAVELLEDLSAYLGRQPKVPDWTVDGVWLGIQGGTETVQKKLDAALEAGVKVAAVWAQDWEGIRITSFGKQLMWDWKYDQSLYNGLPDYIAELNEKGIRFLGYINPFLALEGELYKEASQKGYLVKRKNGEEYHVYITTFPAAMLDLSNPSAIEWIKGIIKKNMLGIGLSGWMADFGEYLPTDSSLYSGESAESFHNKYPVLWAKANYDAISEDDKLDEVVFFTRSGHAGTSRYSTLVWAGDQLVNWSKDDGLPTVIPAGISLGLSGVGIYHSDIGGYTTVAWLKRSKELFMRWTEHSAFTLVMRTHEGNRPQINWQFDSDIETLEHFALMSKVHCALKPYLKQLMHEYYIKGLPVIRHPYIHYENDSELHKLKYQYMLGRDVMIAPVVKPGRSKWKVYLPTDKWLHLWTGKKLEGGWHIIDSPLGQPPVFYLESSEFAEIFKGIRDI
ncbi:MAG: alpha-glucosidase [Bacillota bacterium]